MWQPPCECPERRPVLCWARHKISGVMALMAGMKFAPAHWLLESGGPREIPVAWCHLPALPTQDELASIASAERQAAFAGAVGYPASVSRPLGLDDPAPAVPAVVHQVVHRTAGGRFARKGA